MLGIRLFGLTTFAACIILIALGISFRDDDSQLKVYTSIVYGVVGFFPGLISYIGAECKGFDLFWR